MATKDYLLSLPTHNGEPGQELSISASFIETGKFQPQVLVVHARGVEVVCLYAGQNKCDLRKRRLARWVSRERQEYVIEYEGQVGGPFIMNGLSMTLGVRFGKRAGQIKADVFGEKS